MATWSKCETCGPEDEADRLEGWFALSLLNPERTRELHRDLADAARLIRFQSKQLAAIREDCDGVGAGRESHTGQAGRIARILDGEA